MDTRLKLTVVVIGVFLCFASTVRAQSYPNRAVELVVNAAAGGGLDLFSRSIADPLSKELKVPVNVVNRPGGGGVVGASFVYNSKPDGYTLLSEDLHSFLLAGIITPNIPYDVLTSFKPIAHCGSIPLVLAVRGESKFNSIEELISYARENPGKLIAGTAGVGKSPHVELEIFKKVTGVQITHLPLSGGGEVLPNLLGGHIDMTIINIATIAPHVKTGKIKVLLSASQGKMPSFPNIPTGAEKGIPEFNINIDMGVYGPSDLPVEIRRILENSVQSALKREEVIEKLTSMQYLVRFTSSSESEGLLKKYHEIYKKTLREIGVAK